MKMLLKKETSRIIIIEFRQKFLFSSNESLDDNKTIRYAFPY